MRFGNITRERMQFCIIKMLLHYSPDAHSYLQEHDGMFARVLGKEFLEVWTACRENQLVGLERFCLCGEGDVCELVILRWRLEDR